MTHIRSVIATVLAASVVATAVHAEDSGSSTHTTVDKSGTRVTTETSHSETQGLTGVKKSTSEVSTVVDPKGMMNREKARSQVERSVKPNGDFSEEKTINHANGTLEKVTAEKNTAKHWTDGGKTTTTTETRALDPKGLGNKQVYEAEKKVVEDGAGNVTSTVTEKINGEVVGREVVAPK